MGDGGSGVWLILRCLAVEQRGFLVPGRCIFGRPEAEMMQPFSLCTWSCVELRLPVGKGSRGHRA